MENLAIEFRTIDDIIEFERLWSVLSPNEYLFDDLRYRKCFYAPTNFAVKAIAGYVDNELIGAIFLQFNSVKNNWEFWGGSAMNFNRVFLSKAWSARKSVIPEFYKAVPAPARLEYIYDDNQFNPLMEFQVYDYALDLTGLHSYEEYIDKYKIGTSRKKFLYKIRKVLENDIQIEYNNFADLESLIILNKANWGTDSGFYKLYKNEIFHNILKLDFDTVLCSIIFNGQKESYAFGINYNGIYYGLNSATNKDITNLGKYMMLLRIQKSIENGLHGYNAGTEDLNWKIGAGFKEIPLYLLEKIY